MAQSDPSVMVWHKSVSKAALYSRSWPATILSITSTPRVEPMRQGVHLPQDSDGAEFHREARLGCDMSTTCCQTPPRRRDPAWRQPPQRRFRNPSCRSSWSKQTGRSPNGPTHLNALQRFARCKVRRQKSSISSRKDNAECLSQSMPPRSRLPAKLERHRAARTAACRRS